jgi:hypothetical protein
MLVRAILIAFGLAGSALCTRVGLAAQEGSRVRTIDPPERGFFSKVLDYRGIPIKAHRDVSDEALVMAHARLRRMLSQAPTIVANLRTEAVELHIIGKDQVTSDLPYLRHYKGKPFDGDLTIDERTRGVGGQLVSCGEENLLRLPGDRYAGRDICVHEFAHAILTYGLDDATRARIEDQYHRSLASGLWVSAFAATNVQEFFAELSMWYFGTRGDHGKMSPPPELGRDGLRTYDPEAFRLLDDIYSGRIEVTPLKLVELQPVEPRLWAQQRSSDGTATTIRFRNCTDERLQLLWVDGDGGRTPYGELEPGEQRRHATFAGHVWVLVGPDARDVAMFVATAEPGLAIVTRAGS